MQCSVRFVEHFILITKAFVHLPVETEPDIHLQPDISNRAVCTHHALSNKCLDVKQAASKEVELHYLSTMLQHYSVCQQIHQPQQRAMKPHANHYQPTLVNQNLVQLRGQSLV